MAKSDNFGSSLYSEERGVEREEMVEKDTSGWIPERNRLKRCAIYANE